MYSLPPPSHLLPFLSVTLSLPLLLPSPLPFSSLAPHLLQQLKDQLREEKYLTQEAEEVHNRLSLKKMEFESLL